MTAVSPATGGTAGGAVVTITGSGFTGATGVYFGAAAASSFTVNADGRVTATAPAEAAGTVDITVTSAGGTSATSSADQFTYSANPAPVVGSVTPNTGGIAGGTTVTILGSGFTAASSVFFGATAATSFTVSSDGSVSAIAPAESAGTVDITVTTASGTSATSSADQFTFTAPPAPTVTLLSPTSGLTVGGTSVIVTGTNFTGVIGVFFGGHARLPARLTHRDRR